METKDSQILNDFLQKCVKNNEKCQGCVHCFGVCRDTCFFASRCFENNFEFYKEEVKRMKTYEVTLYKKYTVNLPDDSTEVDALEEAEARVSDEIDR